MIFSKEKLITYLQNNKEASFIEIVKHLNINYTLNKEFSNYLNSLKKEGIIAFSKLTNKYYIPIFIGNFNVEYKTNLHGNGFCFIKLNDNSLEIRVNIFDNNLNAIKGDIINVYVYKSINEDFYWGIQIKIIERKNKYIYAQVDNNLNVDFISFNSNLEIIYNKNDIQKNTYVKFQIEKLDKNKIYLKLKQILFSTLEPYSDINLLVDISNIRDKFPDDVILESNKIPNEVQDIDKFNRKNLTDKLIVTIDGEKTKDFDDAISVEFNSKDNTFTLGIHIADVAYYVKEGTKLDEEAKLRGTSIYLIDKVIPMLPEKLSNGICSLNPNEKRFTLTLESKIDLNGKVLSKKIYPSLIESKYRLTYNQVANMKNDNMIINNIDLYSMLENAYKLSSIIGKNKIEDGYIDFEIEEPVIELDQATGKAISIKKRQRLSSEIMIENFMVFANETISKLIFDLKVPSIYRIHEVPDIEKINSLKMFINSIGINSNTLKNSHDPKSFQAFVNDIKNKRFDNLIKMSLLRTMQKAKYSSDNIGHFGLASKYYSHFTSPIRRYPDLLLHRIIWEVIIIGNKNYSIEHLKDIDFIANQSTNSEIIATDLERKVNDMKKAEYYESLIGTIKESTVISIQKFGLFVEFDDSTNALIHISTLTSSKDYIISPDQCSLTLVDENKTYKLGQKLMVKIISVSKLEGKISAIIID